MRSIMRADLGQGSGAGLASLSDLQRYRNYVDERGVQYASDFFVYTLTIPTLAAGATRTAVLNIQSDSAFEWLDTTATVFDSGGDAISGAAGIELTIVDSASSRNLMSSAVPIGALAGAGGLPFVNPIPRRFMPQTQVTVVAHNYTASTYGDTDSGACQLSLIGRKIFTARASGGGYAGQQLARFNSWQDPQTGRRYTEDLYSYVFKIPTLTHATTVNTPVVMEADSDFEWIMTTYSANKATETDDSTAGTVLAQILDGGTNRQLFSALTSVVNIASQNMGGPNFDSPVLPFMLLQPRIFQSKSPVTLTLQNTDSAADLTDVYFVMHGRKIFELD